MTTTSRRPGRWVRSAVVLIAVGTVLALGACGGDDDESGESGTTDTTAAAESGGEGGGAEGATLDVTEFEFSDVTVPAGGTLEVANSSGGPHTVTADDGGFDEEVGDGETVSVTVPAEPGDYPFHCEIHPNMQATLTVQ
jgi:plastocyanin